MEEEEAGKEEEEVEKEQEEKEKGKEGEDATSPQLLRFRPESQPLLMATEVQKMKKSTC